MPEAFSHVHAFIGANKTFFFVFLFFLSPFLLTRASPNNSC